MTAGVANGVGEGTALDAGCGVTTGAVDGDGDAAGTGVGMGAGDGVTPARSKQAKPKRAARMRRTFAPRVSFPRASGKLDNIMIAATPDLTKSPPRSGREMLGRYAWLARLADKVRAEHAGSQGDYVAYCPISMGFLERTGVTASAFDLLIEQGLDDANLVKYFDQHVADGQRDAANRYVLEIHRLSLDAEDGEEGRL